MHDGKTNETLEAAQVAVAVAGRMMLKRVMGKASFATLQDSSGRIQLYITNDVLGVETHEAFKHWDLGDIVGARGTLFKTRTGELSVRVAELRLLAKALRPLPEKFHGSRFRSRIPSALRRSDHQRRIAARGSRPLADRADDARILRLPRYLEVETPMMHPIPGGAAHGRSSQHHNALDTGCTYGSRRSSISSGWSWAAWKQVFEINRNFRNEGISTRHNPEFTMLEFYEEYREDRYLRDLTRAVARGCAKGRRQTTIEYRMCRSTSARRSTG